MHFSQILIKIAIFQKSFSANQFSNPTQLMCCMSVSPDQIMDPVTLKPKNYNNEINE
jgi:hypothetical protein